MLFGQTQDVQLTGSPTVSMPVTDVDLYEQLQRGDRSALGQLYDRYGGLVYGLSLKVLGNRQEAEDLTQEIFLILWRKQNYDPSRGKLTTFLMMLTRSRGIDRLRSRGRKRKFLGHWGATLSDDTMTTPTPFDEISLTERRDTVRQALDQLPEKYRSILELAYYQGMSQSAIADHLKMPLGTVKTRSRKGLLELREHLKEWMG